MSPSPLLAEEEPVRIEEFVVETRQWVDPDHPVFAGHYPRFPLLPGVFLVDAVHRAVLRHAAERGLAAPRLAEVGSVRFAAPVLPGDTLTVECTVTAVDGGWAVRAGCRTGRGKTATMRLRYAKPADRERG
ncbi:hypothetical protein J5Y04_36985 [Kitasatospora sp. RG8]|uniref:3-hydroxyacyl-ACP dehydratase FabZ family protein n=1 Tax=Kitasatospora sp. RG8 TaxID=2820815 RepID=UPI001AE07B3A|nr:MaoC/PaaZ C-terminal domain-containing protein [Kitasatospora sp. RG8]MBP0455074.1 hypothetical protein [Kitasatospora sp. RG8]